jgi:hypothetical protein
MLRQRDFYNEEGEPVRPNPFVPLEEIPEIGPTPEDSLIAKEEDEKRSEVETGVSPRNAWMFDHRDDDFIPPSETGPTLYDFQVEAANIAADRMKVRKKIETLPKEDRIAIIEAELDRMFVERKLRELKGDDAFEYYRESDGYRGAEPVGKHLKGTDSIRKAA